MDDPMRESFARWVHDAYGHLYDSHHLQNHPLGKLLMQAYPETDGFQRSQALRRVLLDAIQALRPQPKTPAQSPDWRLYSLLEMRYIERLNPLEAMQQLSISKSQFFRDQARALELVTELLWERAQLSMATESLADSRLTERIEPAAATDWAGNPEPQALFSATIWRPIHLGELIEELLPVIQPLAGRHEVAVEPHGLYELPPVRGDRVMLRQALLNVLTLAIASTTSPQVVVTGHSHPDQIVLCVHFAAEQADSDGLDQEGRRLTLAAQIMEAVGGSLIEEVQPAAHAILLRWPSIHQKTLLMVDDNEGLVELFRRYLANESWQIVWARNGQDARQAVEHTAPAAILLDIMMPEEDGWEVLLALRQHPVTQHTPILICSVVNEPSLAESLGAAGYLPKPVSQEALLATLAAWQ